MEAQFGWNSCINNLDDGWTKGPWTPREDKLLIDHVNLHGEGRWNSVSNLTGLKRSGKSCRLRWVNYLRPDLKRGKITPHEETIILDLHARWGNRWSTIARSLPGRTDNEIKNYWRTHFKKGKLTKNIERSRARFLGQQEQKKIQYFPHNEQQQQQQQPQEADVMNGMMPQNTEEAEIAQEVQELAYMFPMSYMFQANVDGCGSTSEEGSIKDTQEATWESLSNLDDRVLFFN